MRAEVKSIGIVSCIDGVAELNVKIPAHYMQGVYAVANDLYAGKPYTLSFEKKKKNRSLSANAYLWTLCGKIAARVGAAKEAVYRKNIREVGAYDAVEVAGNAAERFIERWEKQGMGWVAEPIGRSDNGNMTVLAYYGSSSYTTEEMTRLIDAVIEEAKGLGIETMTPMELARMKEEWG